MSMKGRSMSLDWTRDVLEFHKKIAYWNASRIGELDHEDFTRRMSYMLEELTEFSKAHADGDLYEQVDALVDLLYFGVGTLLRMGVDPRPVWDEVHRANMEKVSAPTHKNSVKPMEWKPPNIVKVIRGLQ